MSAELSAMSHASHYREQARLLLGWAQKSPDRKAAQQLAMRAREMLALAERDPDYQPPPPQPPSMYVPRKHRQGPARRGAGP
jgi:hypothetical protein